MSTIDLAKLPSASDAGWLCAVAGQAQRDLQRCADAHPTLFPRAQFDPALFSAIALANTFAAPWSSATQLRLANRAALWTFALDRLVDMLATSAAEAASIVARCLAVVNDRVDPEGDPLTSFLAEIHTELRASAGFPAVGARWVAELRQMLECMARERAWIEAGEATLPSVDDYLDNSDSLALSFVFMTHLGASVGNSAVGGTAVGDSAAGAHRADVDRAEYLDEIFAAVRLSQRALRLVNDLATYERDLRIGDLNVLRLGIGRADVGQLIHELVVACRASLDPVRQAQPRLCAHVQRQLDYNLSFYGISDYWL